MYINLIICKKKISFDLVSTLQAHAGLVTHISGINTRFETSIMTPQLGSQRLIYFIRITNKR